MELERFVRHSPPHSTSGKGTAISRQPSHLLQGFQEYEGVYSRDQYPAGRGKTPQRVEFTKHDPEERKKCEPMSVVIYIPWMMVLNTTRITCILLKEDVQKCHGSGWVMTREIRVGLPWVGPPCPASVFMVTREPVPRIHRNFDNLNRFLSEGLSRVDI